VKDRLARPLAHFLRAPQRGVLLDVSVVGTSLGVTSVMGEGLARIVAGAEASRAGALAFGLLCIALILLPALAAVLKRSDTHRRWTEDGIAAGSIRPGCLFHPVVSLSLTLTLAAGAAAGIGHAAYGPAYVDAAVPFLGGLAVAVVVSVVQTVLLFRYFTPPQRLAPAAAGRAAAAVGDLCTFAAMLIYGAVWDALVTTPFGRVRDLEDLVARIAFLSAAAMIVYFPPRMLYLVEDLRRPLTWFTLALAHAAMIARVTIGAG
jgi:hypothetical protein